MLRITPATMAGDKSEGMLLRLEGQVTGRWVEELRRVCNETIGHNGNGAHPLVLDLTDVLFIDADGVALFRELTARRVSLTNSSLFVTEQLKEVANAND
jgi:anti-anti-sigma regulatory factor